MADLKTYRYKGNIWRFGKLMASGWEAETKAPSLKRAIVNIKYKAKDYLDLTPDARVEIDTDEVYCVDEELTDLDEIETEEYNRSFDPDYDIPDDWEGSYEDGNLKLRDYSEDPIYKLEYFYNIYYKDNNDYKKEKRDLIENLDKFDLRLLKFEEIHSGPDNCRIVVKGTKDNLDRWIESIGEDPSDYEIIGNKLEFKDSKLKDVYPNKNESKEDFISRFMKETKSEYPNYKQRLAVAYSYWDRYKH